MEMSAYRKAKRPLLPTPAEMRLLQALWALGSATVEEIVNSFPATEQPHYKTTHTLLRIMETKKFVRHSTHGKLFVFEPIVTEQNIAAASVQGLLKQTFGGSTNSLFMHLLQSETLKPGELEEMESLIRQHRLSKKSGGDVP